MSLDRPQSVVNLMPKNAVYAFDTIYRIIRGIFDDRQNTLF